MSDSETKRTIYTRRMDMKRFAYAFIFVLVLVSFTAATVCAAVPAKPVIEGEMPDCYMPIGGDGITLLS